MRPNDKRYLFKIFRPCGACFGLSLKVSFFCGVVIPNCILTVVVERHPAKPTQDIKPGDAAIAGHSYRDAPGASECSGAKQRRHTDYGLEGSCFHTAGQCPTAKDCFL